MRKRYHGGWGVALGLWFLPWIVGTDVPDVAFEVAAAEGAAAVVHVADVEEHGGSGGFGGGVGGVGVLDDDVRALGLAEVDLVGLGREFGGGCAVVDGAEHDHAVAEGELGVHDGVAWTHVDGLLLEAEGAGEPVDGGEGVAVAEPRDDGGGAGFGLVAHGVKDAPFGVRWSWRKRKFVVGFRDMPTPSPPGGYPLGKILRFSDIRFFVFVKSSI